MGTEEKAIEELLEKLEKPMDFSELVEKVKKSNDFDRYEKLVLRNAIMYREMRHNWV